MARASDQVVLITGFPGLQARKLLGWILEREPETHVVVVVLGKLLVEAAAIVEALEPARRARVTVLEGDAAAIDLGLSGAEYRELAAQVTRIHHTAHVSYLGADPQKAAYTNIQGAVEMVELGRASERLGCLVHHSTAQVSGDRTGILFEDELDVGQSFRNPVLETRMQAERVIRQAMDELPVAVVRPTLIVGDSIASEAERLSGPHMLVMMLLAMPVEMAFPMPSDIGKPLDIVPVDFVVRAAHAIGLSDEAPGRTFHLTSSEQLSAREVLERIATALGRRTRRSIVPAQLASTLMRTPGLSSVLREPRALLEQLSCAARYDTTNARRVLDLQGIVCPPLASYVDDWVKAVQQQWRPEETPDDALAPRGPARV